MTLYKLGSRGKEVEQIQQKLKDAGLYAGPIDGEFGGGTRSAVMTFQARNKLEVDGIVGPATWQVLFAGAIVTLYKLGSRGIEVEQIQQKLKDAKLYAGPIDGEFGGGTRSAVMTFQARNGLDVDGIVGPNTWRALFAGAIVEPALSARSLDYKCLALTGSFENGVGIPECFAGISGDFDGQGISFGALQWCFGQGSLQPLLKEMAANHTETMRTIFQDRYQELIDALNSPHVELMNFARSIQDPVKYFLYEPWRGMFRTLGRSGEFQQIELHHAAQKYRTALGMAGTYNLGSERAVALMFDVATQNGSIRNRTGERIRDGYNALDTTLSKDDLEVARMQVVANCAAEASLPRWIEDVRRRKLCIANGRGVVHGTDYDIEAQFGIRLARI